MEDNLGKEHSPNFFSIILKYRRFEKIVWIQSHHLHHLQWKFKLLARKFTWSVKAKHCFLSSKVCWQRPAIAFTSQANFPAHNLKVNMMGSNQGYLLADINILAFCRNTYCIFLLSKILGCTGTPQFRRPCIWSLITEIPLYFSPAIQYCTSYKFNKQLAPICCEKRPKIVPDHLLVQWFGE